MHTMVYVYYLLLVTSFIVSLFNLRYGVVRLMAALLLISILTEVTVEVIGSGNEEHYKMYHIFNLVEYPLVTLILLTFIRKPGIRWLLLISIPIYTAATLCITLFFQSFKEYPSLSSNTESILVIAWCIISFLNIEPHLSVTFLRRSQFWISLAFFSYFSGTFCFNSIYNYLRTRESGVAWDTFTIINSLFNYLLYIFMIIGILCRRLEQKYSV